MTDTMAAQLMAKMRGETPVSRVSEPPVSPETQALWDQMRGGSERDTRRAQAEQHNRDYQAQRSFEARVTKRAQELVNRHGGGHHPREAARTQLRAEDAEKARQDERRANHDAMVKSNRAESEANSTENLRERLRQSSAQRRAANTERLVANLLAQLRATA